MQPQLAQALAAFQEGQLDRARELAKRQLENAPGSPQLEHLLGLIDCRAGRLDSGVEWLRRASESEPDNIPFRVMLVRALVDSGRAREALEAASPPAGTSPAELALWHARAEAAEAAADQDTAAEAWRTLTTAQPFDWRAWSNLGNALAAQESWDEAADALGRARELNPAEAPIRRNLAAALAHSDRLAEASAEFERAIDLDPGHLETRLAHAKLLADQGRNEEAIAELDRASRLVASAADGADQQSSVVDAAIDSPAALYELGLLFERTNRTDALRQLVARVDAVRPGDDQFNYFRAAIALRDGKAEEARSLLLTEESGNDPVRWHRLMARIEDALGEPQAAFNAAAEMNRSVRDFSPWRRRGAEYRQSVRGLARLLTPEWIGPLPQLSPSIRRNPAFLVGFPRSGTTLLDTFLMGHPETRVLEEVHMLGAAERVIGKLAELPNLSMKTLQSAREAYFDELDRHVEPGFPGLVIDKLPLNMLGLPLIHSLFPDARVIFAQRHPCDVVLSGFMQSFVMNDAMACFLTIEDAADFYDAAMDVFTRSRDALPVSVHTIVYEQLISDPEDALRPLINFLGLEWHQELLDHRATATARGAIITPSYDQVTEPLSSRPSGRWRRYEKQLKPVLPVLLPWASRLGYAE